jgi:hypothetical protein
VTMSNMKKSINKNDLNRMVVKKKKEKEGAVSSRGSGEPRLLDEIYEIGWSGGGKEDERKEKGENKKRKGGNPQRFGLSSLIYFFC